MAENNTNNNTSDNRNYVDPSFENNITQCENGGYLIEYGKHDTNDGYFIYYSDKCPHDGTEYHPKTLGIYISESGGFYNNKEWYSVGKDTSAAFEQVFSSSSNDLPDMMIISKRYNDSTSGVNYFDTFIEIANEKTNISNVDVSVYGFSKGTDYAIEFSNRLVSTTNVKSLNITLIDPAGHGDGLYGSFERKKLDGTISNLKDFGANVFMVVPQNKDTSNSVINAIGASGISTYLIKTSENDHLGINYKLLTDGIMGLMSGKNATSFDNSDYEFYKYDNTVWEKMSYGDIKKVLNIWQITDKFSKLSNLSDISTGYLIKTLGLEKDFAISSNLNYVVDEMNKIRGLIKANASSASMPSGGYASTTNIPNECSNTLASYYNSTADLLSIIADETAAIISIGISYDNIDKKILDNIVNLNNINESDGDKVDSNI